MNAVRFNVWECEVIKQKYQNGRVALQLVAIADDMGNEVYKGAPIAMATVNLPEIELKDDEVIIKDYSENEGMLEVLEKAGIVKFIGQHAKSGWVTVPICKLLI